MSVISAQEFFSIQEILDENAEFDPVFSILANSSRKKSAQVAHLG